LGNGAGAGEQSSAPAGLGVESPSWTSGFYIMSDQGIRGWRIDRGLKAIANTKRFAALGRLRFSIDVS
jgi:hypothetical protein